MSGPCAYAGGERAETVGIEFHGILEGKERPMQYEQYGELQYKYRSGEFRSRGYYVDTAGKNASRIAEYIANQ